MKTIEEMQTEVTDFVEAKGWNDTPVDFGLAMALLHSEVSEALEAWRLFGTADATEPPDCEHRNWCDDHQLFGVHLDRSAPAKPEGVGSEFADVFIRLLDDCARFGIDLRAEYERKMAYNRTRSHRHGGKRA